MTRTHVHLSYNIHTAESVGLRRGKPIILKINALKMSENGFTFFSLKNGVWLTKKVPSKFIIIPTKIL